MATPGAIAVYTSGSGIPDNAGARPWRGVYHHWDGHPSGLGNHLIQRVQMMKGNVQAVVRQLIDEAPWGWSNCLSTPAEVATERGLLKSVFSFLRPAQKESSTDRYSKDDPGMPVSPTDTGNVAYVYIFDLEARRLDAFATHVEAKGERVGSVTFSPTGDPDLPALDLLPEERTEEAPLPGADLSPESLLSVLKSIQKLETDSVSLDWVNVEERPDRSLSIVFRVIEWSDGTIENVVEREWNVVPPHARGEPDRVHHFLAALVEVISEDPKRFDAFWIASLDVLRRSQARQLTTFGSILRAHATAAT